MPVPTSLPLCPVHSKSSAPILWTHFSAAMSSDSVCTAIKTGYWLEPWRLRFGGIYPKGLPGNVSQTIPLSLLTVCGTNPQGIAFPESPQPTKIHEEGLQLWPNEGLLIAKPQEP